MFQSNRLSSCRLQSSCPSRKKKGLLAITEKTSQVNFLSSITFERTGFSSWSSWQTIPQVDWLYDLMIDTCGNIKMQQYFVDTLYSPFDSCKENDVNDFLLNPFRVLAPPRPVTDKKIEFDRFQVASDPTIFMNN